jgi:hypothetical protein
MHPVSIWKVADQVERERCDDSKYDVHRWSGCSYQNHVATEITKRTKIVRHWFCVSEEERGSSHE